MTFFFLFILYLFLHKLLKIPFKDQSFVSAWHSFILCPWPWWKRQNLLRFLVSQPLFIGGGYCKKSFPFVTANTLACLIVRGIVMILGDDKRSYMCFLVIFLDAFVRDWWLDRDFSYVWKRWWPYLVTLASSTLMQFFITCWMLMRFSFQIMCITLPIRNSFTLRWSELWWWWVQANFSRLAFSY